MRPARRTAVIAGAALALGCAACLALPEIAAAINGALVPALPMMLLLMYFINRGNTVTQVLFFNCDSSMLSYRFYRQPRVILGIFTARLKSLTAINLLPTAVIALGLPLLLLCSGGTDTPTDYLVLPLAILAMSVFFSVHYLVLYYLLQPYTAGLENTSFGYRLITGLTYFVCYMIYANVHGGNDGLRHRHDCLCRRVCGRGPAAGLSPGPQNLQAAHITKRLWPKRPEALAIFSVILP